MNINKCCILKGTIANEEITIIGGLENNKINIEVSPQKFENMIKKRFEVAYNSPDNLNWFHGYSSTGNIHGKPTMKCIVHIFCEHMLGRDPMTGNEFDYTNKETITSFKLPEIGWEHEVYDENVVY